MNALVKLPSDLVLECISAASTEMNLGCIGVVGEVLIFLATLLKRHQSN
jgi:hypothetical protein